MLNISYLDLFQLILLTITFICVILSLVMSINCSIKLIALEKSTHNVEYVPLDSNWATSNKDIDEINEKSEMGLPPLDDDEIEESDIDLNKMI